ncbi:DNA repair protein RAD4 isoform X2 [Asparagus officinalis]|uniref:DNA repair protein RAD4 isoform X2 n=1 Tax=Asparagus officinalis TaxID=4686 RepID=UPI00098E65EA|nr:DNA repair protein RAD4 isoform X2 [Asparagus officinalis]
MRTRNQSKRNKEEDPTGGSTSTPKLHGGDDEEEGSLARISKEAVEKLLSRANSRRGRKECRKSEDTKETLPREENKGNKEHIQYFGLKRCITENAEQSTSNVGEGMDGSIQCDANEMDWEEGMISISEFKEENVTVEFVDSSSSAQRKRSRKASAEDKELAVLVHKVHLLCLLARGRLVDNACDDPLIQASILSLLPSLLLKIMETPGLKANMLGSLVRWFHENFRVRSQTIDRGSFHSNLAYALEAREGTAEEVAALSVALFRALNLRTRYVSILDVVSLKPDTDASGTLINDAPRLDTRLYSSTTAVASSFNPAESIDSEKDHNAHESQSGNLHKKERKSTCKKKLLKGVNMTKQIDDGSGNSSEIKSCKDNLGSCPTESPHVSKRKGDLEFELQMEMALFATAAGTHDSMMEPELHESLSSSSSLASPLKKLKEINPSALTNSGSSAIWSRKHGPTLCWAEVYCSMETLNGRWVHVDAANGVVDGEEKVEAAAAACRRPLKYVVAFAGNGAKDVTRRYCMQWYKIAPRRINSDWWDTVLAPLKELESRAYAGLKAFKENVSSNLGTKSSELLHPAGCNLIKSSSSQGCTCNKDLSIGISLEDVELETRALTEPLPTSQLAYKSHNLYVIEKWLTKHQILHPKGPVLGYCSGHPVYPRSCVQTLQTKQKWLRMGLQVKVNELPAKTIKHSKKNGNVQISEPNISEEEDGETTIELYGKWQLEPLQLPQAVNGIVPKNEWGRVDAWSEKCLPPGTIHLRLPGLASVAKRLGIDFAPAMTGFEFRNGRSFPVYEGIVICTEFKGAIMESRRICAGVVQRTKPNDDEQRKKNHVNRESYMVLQFVYDHEEFITCSRDYNVIYSLGDVSTCKVLANYLEC